MALITYLSYRILGARTIGMANGQTTQMRGHQNFDFNLRTLKMEFSSSI
jgi:hypothetical protein